MTDTKNIYCPVCDHKCNGLPLNIYTLNEVSEYFCPSGRDPDRNRRIKDNIYSLWGTDKSEFIRCNNCSFGFCYPFVGGNEQFYNILHESKGYPSWKWDYSFAFKEISNLSDECKNIIDIGAGIGLFLDKLNNTWIKYATEGSDETRNHLISKEIKGLKENELLLNEYNDFFDIITMFQVLEHIAEFKELLHNCYKMLKLNGKIIISVPSCEAMINQEKYTGCPDLPPNHINKWTPKSLNMSLEEIGFKVDKIESHPSLFKNIANSIYLCIKATSTKKRH